MKQILAATVLSALATLAGAQEAEHTAPVFGAKPAANQQGGIPAFAMPTGSEAFAPTKHLQIRHSAAAGITPQQAWSNRLDSDEPLKLDGGELAKGIETAPFLRREDIELLAGVPDFVVISDWAMSPTSPYHQRHNIFAEGGYGTTLRGLVSNPEDMKLTDGDVQKLTARFANRRHELANARQLVLPLGAVVFNNYTDKKTGAYALGFPLLRSNVSLALLPWLKGMMAEIHGQDPGEVPEIAEKIKQLGVDECVDMHNGITPCLELKNLRGKNYSQGIWIQDPVILGPLSQQVGSSPMQDGGVPLANNLQSAAVVEVVDFAHFDANRETLANASNEVIVEVKYYVLFDPATLKVVYAQKFVPGEVFVPGLLPSSHSNYQID